MQAQVKWLGDKMKFVGESRGFETRLDAKPPFGEDSAATPKELVLQGLCGCTAMDAIALLKKYKQPVEGLTVAVQTDTTKGHPAIFTELILRYEVTATEALDLDKVKQAVELSRTQYCGVIAMLEKSSPVSFSVWVNGQQI